MRIDHIAIDAQISPVTVKNDLVKGTNALKNGHITYLDPSYW